MSRPQGFTLGKIAPGRPRLDRWVDRITSMAETHSSLIGSALTAFFDWLKDKDTTNSQVSRELEEPYLWVKEKLQDLNQHNPRLSQFYENMWELFFTFDCVPYRRKNFGCGRLGKGICSDLECDDCQSDYLKIWNSNFFDRYQESPDMRLYKGHWNHYYGATAEVTGDPTKKTGWYFFLSKSDRLAEWLAKYDKIKARRPQLFMGMHTYYRIESEVGFEPENQEEKDYVAMCHFLGIFYARSQNEKDYSKLIDSIVTSHSEKKNEIYRSVMGDDAIYQMKIDSIEALGESGDEKEDKFRRDLISIYSGMISRPYTMLLPLSEEPRTFTFHR